LSNWINVDKEQLDPVLSSKYLYTFHTTVPVILIIVGSKWRSVRIYCHTTVHVRTKLQSTEL